MWFCWIYNGDELKIVERGRAFWGLITFSSNFRIFFAFFSYTLVFLGAERFFSWKKLDDGAFVVVGGERKIHQISAICFCISV